MIELKAIERAAALLEDTAIKTPLVYSNYFSEKYGARVYLKLENLQKTGSFKFRGAYYKLAKIRNHLGTEGVVAASAGNHAQGVAHAAHLMGVPAVVVMPEWASISKQMATRSYGARVILKGKSLTESLAHARKLGEQDRTFIHPYDDEDIITGQGTIGLEILSELPDVNTVLIPIGGGGLIAGVSTALKSLQPQSKVIGVQTASCASAVAARHQGKPIAVPVSKSLADGISVKQTGELTFTVIDRLVDDIVTVEEEQIAAAMLELLERKKVLAEGAGAVPLAALAGNRLRYQPESTVVLIISGGNVDSHLLGRILHQGLFRTGRILRFSVQLEDIPGALAELLSVVGSNQGNVLHIHHDRMGRNLPLGLSRVELEVETRNSEHVEQLINALASGGYEVSISL